MEGNNVKKSDEKSLNGEFVLLIEENKVILEKSQRPSMRKKKEEAIAAIIEKWTTISNTTLTHESLLKKLNNLKGRAKSALNKGNPLAPWQSKILEMTVDVSEPAENKFDRNQEGGAKSTLNKGNPLAPSQCKTLDMTVDNVCEPELLNISEPILIEVLATGESVAAATDEIKTKVENFLNQFETEESKYLTNEQLQRIAVLQQIRLQALKQKKLELQLNNGNYSFEFSAFNPLNLSTTD